MLSLINPLHRAAATPGVLLLRFQGSSHSDPHLVYGQQGGMDGSWHPFVWAMHNAELCLIEAVTARLSGAPLLALGLVWTSCPGGNEQLLQEGTVTLTQLAPLATRVGLLDLFAGLGTWAAATRLGVPLLGSLDNDLVALQALNRQGHTTFGSDFCNIGLWEPVLATSPVIICASPPCQPWTRAGLQGGFLDKRAEAMLKLPVLPSGVADVVLMEQVPAFATHDNGRSARAWTKLWQLCGFQLHCETFEAQDLLPVVRSRLMIWAWRRSATNLGQLAPVRSGPAGLSSPTTVPSTEAFFGWGRVIPPSAYNQPPSVCMAIQICSLGKAIKESLRKGGQRVSLCARMGKHTL